MTDKANGSKIKYSRNLEYMTFFASRQLVDPQVIALLNSRTFDKEIKQKICSFILPKIVANPRNDSHVRELCHCMDIGKSTFKSELETN